MQRVPGSSAKPNTVDTVGARSYDQLDSLPDQDESFKLNIKTIEESQADAEEGSGQRLQTFGQSPVEAVASSIDISPGQSSYGFDVQQIRVEPSPAASAKEEGLSKLIEHMDQDHLRETLPHSNKKTVEQRAAEKTEK